MVSSGRHNFSWVVKDTKSFWELLEEEVRKVDCGKLVRRNFKRKEEHQVIWSPAMCLPWGCITHFCFYLLSPVLQPTFCLSCCWCITSWKSRHFWVGIFWSHQFFRNPDSTHPLTARRKKLWVGKRIDSKGWRDGAWGTGNSGKIFY